MTTGAAKTDTILPSSGVDPYSFGTPKMGDAVRELGKTAASFSRSKKKADKARVAASAETKAALAAGTAARRGVRAANKSIKGLEAISNLSQQQFPSSPLSASPSAKKAKARLTRGMKPGAGTKKRATAPAGTTSPTFQEPTTAQKVAEANGKAKQVRPRKKTSLSTNPL